MQKPQWIEEIDLALPVCSQFVIHGNIRDQNLVPVQSGNRIINEVMTSVAAIGQCLIEKGYRFILVFNLASGYRIYPDTPAAQSAVEQVLKPHLQELDLRGKGPRKPPSPNLIPYILHDIVNSQTPCGFVMDNASRLVSNINNIQQEEMQLFAALEQLSLTAQPRSNEQGGILFNPVIWLLNRSNDFPDWFSVGNDRVRTIVIGDPDYAARRSMAEQAARFIEPGMDITSPASVKLLEDFARRTDGLTIRAIDGVSRIAKTRKIAISKISEAIRCYKVGVPRDPWAENDVRKRIKEGEASLSDRVRGQSKAVTKTLDILKRSVLGLSGAQATSSPNRPRGVLFFAGPTGVGKTDLAKGISKLIFGNAEAYVRFDMSEFSSEHSDARLLGAPPGYVGYDAGGELVNAIRRKPFSVILFDEIEKAHYKILDKFLQIIEDGRLTDGRGDTVYFSDAVIVFTSNLGIHDVDDPRKPNVVITDEYETIETKILGAITHFFRNKISRPEILNRIGDNIVVFDFIRPHIAIDIFGIMLDNVRQRVKDEQDIDLTFTDSARAALQAVCIADLSHGGRGIGNAIEERLVNPLARTLFDSDARLGSKQTVQEIGAGPSGVFVRLG